jgi:hypothetical protein
MQKNYVSHTRISLPKSSKIKSSLTRIQQLIIMKKDHYSIQERIKRASANSGFQGITLHQNKIETSEKKAKVFYPLASYEIENRLVRIKNIQVICN